jgi:hypothetical protein
MALESDRGQKVLPPHGDKSPAASRVPVAAARNVVAEGPGYLDWFASFAQWYWVFS